MKIRFVLTLALLFIFKSITAQNILKDSIESGFKFRTGVVKLNEAGTLTVPAGFKYLDAETSRFLLTEVWGNPAEQQTLGMMFPADKSVFDSTSIAFNIYYDAIGYVKDKDAADINYDVLLADIKKSQDADNKERKIQGADLIEIKGWARKPAYDKVSNTLQWAQELHLSSVKGNTFNYNVRVLGSKGVLAINAIGDMSLWKELDTHSSAIASSLKFEEGSRYADFKTSDKVSEWTIKSLVADRIIHEDGIPEFIAKYSKVLIVVLLIFIAIMWKFIKNKKKRKKAALNGEQAS